jgi:hypothetical protein
VQFSSKNVAANELAVDNLGGDSTHLALKTAL